MTPTFSPVWLTDAGTVGSAAEASSTFVATFTTLDAEVRAVVPVAVGQTYAVIGSNAAAQFLTARLGTSTIAATPTADGIRFAPVGSTGALEVVLNRPVTFGLLSGTLPPGISLTASGVFAGTVGEIRPEVQAPEGIATYEFVVRAASGGIARDRTFTIDVNWTDEAPRWSDDYPSTGTFTVAPPSASPPVLSRGAPFSFAFEVTDRDSLPPPATLVSGSLPAGLRYDPARRRIDGIVALTAPLGTYRFGLSVARATIPERQFQIVVSERDPNQTLAPPLSLGWVTPSGTLGTIRDNDRSPLGVRAEATNDAVVGYSLVSGSDSLPPGLAPDPNTGNITGIATGGLGIYTFAVRARVGGTFEDRVFSITITEFYNATSLVTISLDVPGPLGDSIVEPYAAVLTGRRIFRPANPDFGLPATASIYLLGGLSASDNALVTACGSDGGLAMPESGFHQWRELRLGGHRLFTVTQGGRTLYEVLVRLVTDPLAGAGGFAPDGASSPVPYPPDDGVEVRTASVANARRDLVRDLGFATLNAALQRRLGPTGGEAMPLWMRGQADYVLGFPVAYLIPGEGTAALAQATAAEGGDLPRAGTVVAFSGYATRRTLRPSGTVETGFIPLPRPKSGRPR